MQARESAIHGTLARGPAWREREVDLGVGLEGCGTRNRHATSTHPAGKIASLAHTPLSVVMNVTTYKLPAQLPSF